MACNLLFPYEDNNFLDKFIIWKEGHIIRMRKPVRLKTHPTIYSDPWEVLTRDLSHSITSTWGERREVHVLLVTQTG